MDAEGKCCAVNPTKPPSKRRAAAMDAPPEDSPRQEKKRFSLGELPNNITQTPDLEPKSKPTSKAVAQKDSIKSAADLHHESSASDRLQKCADSPLLYRHLRSLEAEEERRPLPDYMEKVQREIRPAMREIVVDWLVEAAGGFELVSDTIYLTVNFIDRYLSSHSIATVDLQLLGVSCLLVASKVEEITPPRVEDCCYVTDNTYTKDEVIAMESNLLKFLNHSTYTPTPKSFIRIFTEAVEEKMLSNQQFEFLVSYFAELSLTTYACVKFLPSVVAASAVFVARFTLLPTMHPWSLALQRYTGYKASELKECILAIHNVVLLNSGGSRPVRAVRDKYMKRKYKCVAALCPLSKIPRHYFEAVSE